MSTSQVFRVAAVLLLIGGILGLLGGLISPNDLEPRQQVANSLFLPANLLAILGALLTVLAFPAVYARISGDAGWIGLAGFAGVMLAGIMLGFFGSTLSLLIFPWMVSLPISPAAIDQGPQGVFAYFMVSSVIALIGAVLFGIAIVRTRVFSQWPGYLLILAGIVNLVTSLVPNAPPIVQAAGGDLFYISLAWVGYELWQQSYESGLAGI